MPHRRAYRWLAVHPWVTSLIMVTLLTVAAAYRDVERDNDQDRFARCVAEWADATARRAGELGKARAELDTANDNMWRTFDALLAQPRPDGRDVFRAELDKYKVASDKYKGTVSANPPPLPPRLDC